MTTPTTTMLYDADCGICTAAAAWLMRRSRPGQLRAVPLQGVTLPGQPDLTQTLHVVTPDTAVLTGSRAVLAAARTVPRWGVAARIADNKVGHMFLEPAYRWVARHRRGIGRALGINQVCAVPESSPVTPPRTLR